MTGDEGRWRPYPAYRDSGVEWLDTTPAHWSVVRLKFVTRISPPRSEIAHVSPLTEVSFLPMEKIGEDGSLDLDETRLLGEIGPGYTYFRDGDIIVAKITPCFENGKGALCRDLVNGIGLGTTELHVIRPQHRTAAGFLNYLTRSYLFRSAGAGMMSGAAGQKRVPESFINDFLFGLPPIAEQRAIVTFLDRETARIDALIAKQRQLIERLQEQRIALISQAVMKGLDSSVPMSDSGIPWLGTVPAHWDLPRLKFLSNVQTGLTLGHDYGRRETVSRPYLRVANVQDGFLDLTTITTVQIPREEVPRYELQKDDVLMTEGGDFDKLGRGYVWDGQIESCLHQNHIFAVRCNPNKLDPYFLDILTTSLHGKNYFTRVSRQTTNLATINQTTLGDFPVPLPPIEEQKAILAHIRELTGRLDALIIGVKTGIVQLHEYRAALISAAVTGKIDVRGAIA